jgi:hypothetical protein
MSNVVVLKGVIVNEQEFRQHLAAYCRIMGGSAAKLLQKQARLFCEDMAAYVYPLEPDGVMGQDGISQAARLNGTNRVRGQIEGIFMPLAYVGAGEILAYGNEGIFTAWLSAKKKIPEPKIPNWLLTGSPLGKGKSLWTKFQEWEYAKKQTTKAGKVDLSTYYTGNIQGIHERTRGGNKKASYFAYMKKAGEVGKPSVVSDTGAEILAYSKRVEKRVGELKSAWYAASVGLGSIKSAAWIKGNQWGTGIQINELQNPTEPAVTVGNTKQGLHGQYNPNTFNWYKYCMYHRAYAMRVEMVNKLVKGGNANTLYHLAQTSGVGAGLQYTP